MSEPIRVLQVIGSMNRGGAESMIMNIYRCIDREKVQFDFLVTTKEKAAFDDEIISLGGKIYHDIDRINKGNLLSYLSICNKFFKEHKYGLVHCHIGSISQFISASARHNGAFTVAHSHSATKNKQYRFLSYPARFTANYYMACSDKAGLVRFGKRIVNSKKYSVLKNAIESQKYKFDASVQEKIRKDLGIENKFVVGHIGRITYQKNHDFLIDVFNSILKIRPQSVLILAGDGPLVDATKEKINNLGINKNVLFLGVVNNVNEYLNAFDIMIFPSRYEGLPVAIVEAQANGLECLLSDGISKETKISDCIEFLSLDLGSEEWAKKALEIKDYSHKNTLEDIKKAGFDVKSSAKWLENFYIEHYKKI